MTSPEDSAPSGNASPTAPAAGWVARLRARKGLMKVASNSGWLMAEQLLRLGLGFVLGVWTARHVGPADFGLLSYAMAYTAVFAAVGMLGLNRILVRELVSAEQLPDVTARLLSTAFFLRLGASLLLYTLALAGAVVSSDQTLPIVALVSASLIFGTSDTVDLFFMSRVQSRQASQVRLVAMLVSAGSRTVLLLAGAPVIAFAALTLCESALIAALLQFAFRRAGMRFRWRDFDPSRARSLMRECAPEILAGLGINLFMRLDQILLNHLTSPDVVGTFAVAARLTELWYFIPIAVVSSTFPGIVALREANHAAYMARLQTLTAGLVSFGYMAVLLTWLVVSPLIVVVFGADYAGAAPILLVQVWCIVFMVLGQTSGAWLMAERKVKFNLYRGILGLVVNLAVSIALIPRFAGLGAAFGTLASMLTAYLLFDFLHPETRPMGWLKVKALLQVPAYRRAARHVDSL